MSEKLDFTLAYKNSEEYKELYRQVKSLNASLPEYLVDLVIAAHKMNPIAYRDKKLHRQEAELQAKVPKVRPEDLVLNTVQILSA